MRRSRHCAGRIDGCRRHGRSRCRAADGQRAWRGQYRLPAPCRAERGNGCASREFTRPQAHARPLYQCTPCIARWRESTMPGRGSTAPRRQRTTAVRVCCHKCGGNGGVRACCPTYGSMLPTAQGNMHRGGHSRPPRTAVPERAAET